MVSHRGAGNLTKRYLTGKEFLSAATDLLHRVRLEGPYEGLYEAADIQWWWRKENYGSIPDHQLFWFDTAGNAVACLLRQDGNDEWANDFMWLPSAKAVVEAKVIPEVIAIISDVDKPSSIFVREDDNVMRHALQAAGFAQSGEVLVQAELVQDPPKTALPPGFYLTSRVEDTLPHHMIKRNGAQVATRLAECSLYRPDLDLCIRDASGEVAAYVLFWMDEVTKVGLVEPVRTETQFQRLGLARHLLAEGISRLRDLGAIWIRVNHFASNPAATNLYHRCGFVDQFNMLEYRLEAAV
jgi:predicted N-acetyltransferase YhbS